VVLCYEEETGREMAAKIVEIAATDGRVAKVRRRGSLLPSQLISIISIISFLTLFNHSMIFLPVVFPLL